MIVSLIKIKKYLFFNNFLSKSVHIEIDFYLIDNYIEKGYIFSY